MLHVIWPRILVANIYELSRETCVPRRRAGQDGAVPISGGFIPEVLFLCSQRGGVKYRRSFWDYTCATPLQDLRQGSLNDAIYKLSNRQLKNTLCLSTRNIFVLTLFIIIDIGNVSRFLTDLLSSF